MKKGKDVEIERREKYRRVGPNSVFVGIRPQIIRLNPTFFGTSYYLLYFLKFILTTMRPGSGKTE